MVWKQVIDPFGNSTVSVLVAAVLSLFIFWALIIRKVKSCQPTLIAILIAISVYGMPPKLALLSAAHGAMYGLRPICWLVIMAVFLFNVTVKSGQFGIIKHVMASITADRRLQALLIAFSFSSFLKGTAGFYVLTFICFLTLAQAYVLKWMIPVYEMQDLKKTTVMPDVSQGYTYLLILVILLSSLAFAIIRTRRNEKPTPNLVR